MGWFEIVWWLLSMVAVYSVGVADGYHQCTKDFLQPRPKEGNSNE